MRNIILFSQTHKHTYIHICTHMYTYLHMYMKLNSSALQSTCMKVSISLSRLIVHEPPYQSTIVCCNSVFCKWAIVSFSTLECGSLRLSLRFYSIFSPLFALDVHVHITGLLYTRSLCCKCLQKCVKSCGGYIHA